LRLRRQRHGGTIDQVNGSGCVLDMTQTRAQELEDLVGP